MPKGPSATVNLSRTAEHMRLEIGLTFTFQLYTIKCYF